MKISKKTIITIVFLLICSISVLASIKGDVNGDGVCNAADVTALYNWILNNAATALKNGDQNNDGVVNAGDVTTVYNIILNGSGTENPDSSIIEISVSGVKFNMVKVEGGTFKMGATSEQGNAAQSIEKPAHQVTLSSFAIGQTEVTQELWQAVMGSNPSTFSDDPRIPVHNISWDDCIAFIDTLNEKTGLHFRLLTEAEWEYAARGGNKSQHFMFSGSFEIDDVGWYKENCNNKPQVVAQKQPNELGLYDMSGNVDEWCNDWRGSYSSEPQVDPQGPDTGERRAARGGHYARTEEYCRVSARNFYPVTSTGAANIGFRLALSEAEGGSQN